jgi:ADP-ribose pyrophosphatase YjhB (NUDIX family)
MDALMKPQRIDCYNSPNAPRANSLVPSVNVVVVNDAGEILLIRRTDNGNWAVPGGAIDLGESVAQAAVSETLEESGIECVITGIVGIHSDPRHVILLHKQRRGTARILHRPHRAATGRSANTQQRVKRGPLGPGSRTPRSHDGPVDAQPRQRLPLA